VELQLSQGIVLTGRKKGEIFILLLEIFGTSALLDGRSRAMLMMSLIKWSSLVKAAMRKEKIM